MYFICDNCKNKTICIEFLSDNLLLCLDCFQSITEVPYIKYTDYIDALTNNLIKERTSSILKLHKIKSKYEKEVKDYE